MANEGEFEGRVYFANKMSPIEFDAFRKEVARGALICVGVRGCRGRLYPRRRHWGLQEFVHFPGEESERCPYAQGETQTHHDMKESLAWAGERLGYRAETETRVGQRIVDVALYSPDKDTTTGLAFCLEAQNSLISAEEFEERDRNHWDVLNALHVPGEMDRRAALWVFNHDPSALADAAYIKVDKDDLVTVTGGIYPVKEHLDGAPFVVEVGKAISAIRRGTVWMIRDTYNGVPVARWVAAGGLFADAERGKKPRNRKPPDKSARDCYRPTPVAATDAQLTAVNHMERASRRRHFDPARILATSMARSGQRPNLNPWEVELAGGPYDGCDIRPYTLGPYVTVTGEHGSAAYSRDEAVTVEPFCYRFDKAL